MSQNESVDPVLTDWTLHERADRWLAQHRDGVIAELQALVRIPSPSGSEAPLAEHVRARLASLGCSARLLDSWPEAGMDGLSAVDPADPGGPDVPSNSASVLAVVEGKGGGRSLTLNAHVDTVPIQNPADWLFPPTSGAVQDGRLYGRGALDDKSGVCVALTVVRMLKELAPSLCGDLVIQAVAHEETGGAGTARCLEVGPGTDAAILLENVGQGMIVCGARGVSLFRIRLRGDPVSNLALWTRPNMLLLAAELCIEIEKLNVWRNQQMEVHPLWAMYPPQFPRAPVVVCRMVGGEHFATTPFGVLLEGSAECQPGEGIAAMRSAVEGTLAEFAHSRGLRMGEQVSLEWWGMHADPTVTDPGHPIVETLAACSEAVLGHPSMRVGAGGCDMFRFGSVQVPSVMYGAAGDNGHGIDEWVDIDSLLQTIKVVFLTTLCWCGRGETLTQALTNPAAGARTPSGSTPAA